MRFSLKRLFNKKIRLEETDLRTLDEQFSDLGEKIKAGDYVVTTQAKPAPRTTATHKPSCFEVVIKPAERNSASSIKSMVFECTDGRWPSSARINSTWFNFKIKTRDNQTFIGHVGHQPGNPDTPEYKFLKYIADLGRAGSANAAQQASAAVLNTAIKL